TERQPEYRNNREAGASARLTQTIPHILHDVFEPPLSPTSPCSFLRQGRVTEATQRCIVRLFRRSCRPRSPGPPCLQLLSTRPLGRCYFDLAPENADANPSAKINPPPETLRWTRRSRKLPRIRSATVPAINA